MGLLNRMLFGNAKAREEMAQYNSIVENIVKTNFNIDLDHITNSYYSREWFYRSTYKLYNHGLNTNEAAATVMGDYLQSILWKSELERLDIRCKSDMSDDATNLVRQLVMFIKDCLGRGEIDRKHADLMFSVLQKMAFEYTGRTVKFA